MAVLCDTNILLRLAEPSDPDYPVVREAVDSLVSRSEELCFTSQNLVEFWNVSTRVVTRNGFGLSIPDTDRRAKIIESEFRFLPDNWQVHQNWRRLVVTYGVPGAKVHDARLVAAMLVHGVTQILTLNDRDFARYTGVSAVHPRSVRADG